MVRGVWFGIALALAGTARAAGPAGPSIVVKQVAPPKTMVSGVKTLQVNDFKGPMGPEVAAQVRAALADPERMKSDAAAIGKEALDVGTDLAAQYVGSLVGGGIGSKLVEGLTKNTVTAVRNEIEEEPLILDAGLTINPFTVVESGADATLTGVISVSDTVESFTQKQQARDGDGNPRVDSEGKAIMVEVSCKRRMVDVQIDWSVRGTGNAKGEVKRQSGDSRCGSDVSNLLDANTIAAGVLAGAGMPIVRDLAPAWRVKRLPMNKTKAAKDALKVNRQGDWQAARCAFRTAAEANPDDSDALFNHGVMLEAFGYFDAAQARYEQALALKVKKPYENAVERLAKRRAEVESMTAAYGLTWTVPAQPTDCT